MRREEDMNGTSTITPRAGGGFTVEGDIVSADIYTSPNSTLPSSPDVWINLVCDGYDGHMRIELECLDHLIEALTAIRDERAARA